MSQIQSLVHKAKKSGFYLRVLNYGLSRRVPFNRPHGFRILSLADRQITTFAPYKKKNLNHIGGMHACAMATLAEFSTGFLLMCSLDMQQYRLIMRKIEMEFFYQARQDVTAFFEVSEEWMKQHVTEPLEREGLTEVTCEIRMKDREGNHLCTGPVSWQIKDWQKVRTK